MSGVAVRGIVVDGQAARGRVVEQLTAREWQQRPHEAAAGARGDTGEAGGCAAAQRPQHNRLELVVLVMCRDEIP